ncbi:fibronectin type III domain-containing protein [Actinosynnema sp. CS-041913]|uniref:fibronectin type III domain-containing protein n=1 Tax=Actinosynnema sp. CS-041913 TaxID=3239917 RepID=UPI003D89D31D
MTTNPVGARPSRGPALSAVSRTRVMIAALVAGCVGLVGVAVAGQGPIAPGLQFIQVGHWVYSTAFQSAYHVDGSTGQVDARVALPGVEQGSQVVQGEKSGYVVERSRITVFGKSTLSVENTVTPPATEHPVVLEVAGGPYLVYRNAGQVVRLGDPMATVPAGGPLSEPTATADGSVWLHRIDTGSLCELPRDATRMSCPAQLEPGHTGSLTVVDDRPVLVDTTTDSLRTFGEDGFGESVALGLDLPASAQVASSTADGRLAVVDPDRKRLHLVDTAGLRKRPVAKPVEVELPAEGRFAGPVAVAQVVTLVDQNRDELLTYDSSGSRKSVTKVPGAGGPPRLARGEDERVYVERPDGSHVLVVDGRQGSVAHVEVGKDLAESASQSASATSTTASTTASTTISTTVPPPTGEQPPADDETRSPRTLATKPAAPPVAAATPPGAPGDVGAVAGDGSAAVTWSPAAANGAPVTAYHLLWSGGSTSVDGSAVSATVHGLANGVAVAVTVVAENSAGRGPGASAPPVIPLRAAAAPEVTATTGPGGNVDVTWNQPDLGGGTLVHYLVSAAGQADREVTGTSTQFWAVGGITGLVTVRAITRFGPPGSPTVTGLPGTDVIPTPFGYPIVKILKVTRTGPESVTATVDVNTSGTDTTCEASIFNLGGVPTTTVPCAGVQDIVVHGAPTDPAAQVQVMVYARNATGQGQPATWMDVPAPASGPTGGAGGAPPRRTGLFGAMAAR